MDTHPARDAARVAFARGDWRAARDGLRAADVAGDLTAADHDLLSRAVWILGDVPGSMVEAERAFTCYLDEGRTVEAADLSLRLTAQHSSRADHAMASAWFGRASRLLQDEPVCATTGYLRYAQTLLSLQIDGAPEAAATAAADVAALGQQFADPTLTCFAGVLRGVSEVRNGRAEEGFAHLDEAMLPVMAGQVDPLWAGDIYCAVIHVCEGLADLGRMRAWTDALERWVRPLPEAFVYAGVTRVHRLQLLAAEGDWDAVEAEMGQQSADLLGAHSWVAGAGFTELGDIRRLRGDVDGARRAYELARRTGVDPQPGEAQLLLDRGEPALALAALLGAIGGAGRLARARLLLPTVEAALRAGDLTLAASTTADLEEIAEYFRSPGLLARAHEARAALLLARARPEEALAQLAEAVQIYREQRFRHATARVHEKLAQAHADLGAPEASMAAAATAHAIYTQLGARPDAERLAPRSGAPPGGLTAREVDVLQCVATGATNREVATRLFISEKTVGRHLANIFVKLDVSSRTAAVAWARANGVHGT